MRLVQVTIPAGKREAVLALLDEEGIDYVVTDETSGREYAAVAYVPRGWLPGPVARAPPRRRGVNKFGTLIHTAALPLVNVIGVAAYLLDRDRLETN